MYYSGHSLRSCPVSRWQVPVWQQSRRWHGWRAVGHRDVFTSARINTAAASPNAAAVNGKAVVDTVIFDTASPDTAAETPPASPNAGARASAANPDAASDGSTAGEAGRSGPVSSPSQPQPTSTLTTAAGTCWHLNAADARAVATNDTIIFSVRRIAMLAVPSMMPACCILQAFAHCCLLTLQACSMWHS